MIQIKIRTNTAKEIVNAEITASPNAIFGDLSIDPSQSRVTLNGDVITNLNKTFEELGVTDGTSNTLNAIVKADGAAE